MASEAAVARGSTAALRAAVRAVPVWAWLGGLVVVSTLVRYALGRQMVAPWIFVDELIYSELAKSLAAHGHFLIRGVPSHGYGVVYPALVSPAWKAFGPVPDAYAAAKTINGLLMSLTALPAYFLARRVLSQRWSLAVAALAVSAPSMLYTGTVMTENAFYPVFLCAALALQLLLEKPTIVRQLAVLVLLALAYETRPQAISLVPVIVTAPLLLALVRRGGLRSLRPYLPTAAAIGGVAVVILAVELGRGRSPAAALGAYAAAGKHSYGVGSGLEWLLYHLGELSLYVAFVPALALLCLAFEVRSLAPRAQAFLVGTVALLFWTVLEVAFISELAIPRRVEERYMFYLAPSLLVALFLWIERGLPRRRLPLIVSAVTVVTLAALLPWRRMIHTSATSDTLAAIPWWRLQDTLFSFGWVRPVVALLAAVAVVLFALVPRRFAWTLPALVLTSFCAVAWYAADGRHSFREASLGSLWAGIRVEHPDWIDRAAGRDAQVSLVWSGTTDAHTIWSNEFFNRSIQTVYNLGQGSPGGLPETSLHQDPATGFLLDGAGREVEARYVLADASLASSGRVVARDPVPPAPLALYRVDGPLRSLQRVQGLYGDTWSGRELTYTRYACSGGRLVVQLSSDPKLFTAPQTVVARVGGRAVARRTFAPYGSASLAVPLAAGPGERCVVRFAVSPTKVPGPHDPRELGVHFDSFRFLAEAKR